MGNNFEAGSCQGLVGRMCCFPAGGSGGGGGGLVLLWAPHPKSGWGRTRLALECGILLNLRGSRRVLGLVLVSGAQSAGMSFGLGFVGGALLVCNLEKNPSNPK